MSFDEFRISLTECPLYAILYANLKTCGLHDQQQWLMNKRIEIRNLSTKIITEAPFLGIGTKDIRKRWHTRITFATGIWP